MKKFWIALLCFYVQIFEGVLIPRTTPAHFTTSVLIPCVAKHFALLHPLLECYQNQTVPPDEVVISLSETNQIDSKWISELENTQWPFHLKIICHPTRKLAGMNRNIAGQAAEGDIFIYQDADDLPHPQRIEVTKFVFENYFVDHMLHQFISGAQAFKNYHLSQIEVRSYDIYHGWDENLQIHNGNICVSKEVGRKILWPEIVSAEDLLFNAAATKIFKNRVLVHCDLIRYRAELSAYEDYKKRNAR